MKKISIFLCLILVLVFSSAAQSSLIEKDLSSGHAGNRLLTYDTETHLTWLDISATNDMSINQVLDSTYVKNLGFRYATENEVRSLFANMGLTLGYVEVTGDDEPVTLMTAMGLLGFDRQDYEKGPSHTITTIGKIGAISDKITVGKLLHRYDPLRQNGQVENTGNEVAIIEEACLTQTGDAKDLERYGNFLVFDCGRMQTPQLNKELEITKYIFVSEKRIDRTLYEYVFKAEVTNIGAEEAQNVKATLSLTSTNITIIDNLLDFGNVPAGGKKESTDTFKINYDMTIPFTGSIDWTFEQDQICTMRTIIGNTGVAGTTINYSLDEGSPKTATSDNTGNYSITVPDGWSGTVTPTKNGYSFKPFSKSYSNIVANKPGEDYTATTRFIDNGNGTISDTKTGLVWQKQDDGTERSWSDAVSYAKNLKIDGFEDWRLPSIDELKSIIDYNRYEKNLDPVFNFRSAGYWSDNSGSFNLDVAWYVNFINGSVNFSSKGDLYFVTCVRSGPYGALNPSLVNNNDGTVTDMTTGLMWQKSFNDVQMSWNDANKYAEGLTFADYSDWRLPTVEELSHLVDYNRSFTEGASINPVFDCWAVDFWSGSTYSGDKDVAWYVYFHVGVVGSAKKAESSFVRCVRREFFPKTLTIRQDGTDSGTISINTLGINCGDTTASYTFKEGATISLSATAEEGSKFVKWSGGACDGANTNPCTISINEDTLVTPVFQSTYPIIFIHGSSGDISVENTWTYLISQKLKSSETNYLDQGKIFEQTPFADNTTLSAKSLPANSIFSFSYYRAGEKQTYGIPIGKIGLIPKQYNPDTGNICDTLKGGPGYDDPERISFAERLGKVVDKVLILTGAKKVNIVSHSMGGVVARAYIRWGGGGNKVNKLLTVGTPNKGVPCDGGYLAFHGAVSVTGSEWRKEAELRELSKLPYFEGKSYTDWLNEGWESYCAAHGIKYATIRGNFDPWVIDYGGDGVIQENDTIMDGAIFNLVDYAAHADSEAFPIAGVKFSRELSLVTSSSVAEVIKSWMITNSEVGDGFLDNLIQTKIDEKNVEIASLGGSLKLYNNNQRDLIKTLIFIDSAILANITLNFIDLGILIDNESSDFLDTFLQLVERNMELKKLGSTFRIPELTDYTDSEKDILKKLLSTESNTLAKIKMSFAEIVELIGNNNWQGLLLPQRVNLLSGPYAGKYNWLAGDFDHDGKTDLVNIIPSESGYVHVWFSRDDGTTFTVTPSYSPWLNYNTLSIGSLTQGWIAYDVDKDGKTDLVHTTASGSTYLWISQGDGTFNVSLYTGAKPWAGTVLNQHLDLPKEWCPWPDCDVAKTWLSGNFNSDGKTDLIQIASDNSVKICLSNGNNIFNTIEYRPNYYQILDLYQFVYSGYTYQELQAFIQDAIKFWAIARIELTQNGINKVLTRLYNKSQITQEFMGSKDGKEWRFQLSPPQFILNNNTVTADLGFEASYGGDIKCRLKVKGGVGLKGDTDTHAEYTILAKVDFGLVEWEGPLSDQYKNEITTILKQLFPMNIPIYLGDIYHRQAAEIMINNASIKIGQPTMGWDVKNGILGVTFYADIQ